MYFMTFDEENLIAIKLVDQRTFTKFNPYLDMILEKNIFNN